MKQTIKRESTWDYDLPEDETGWVGTETVETVETWEWNDELNRYELVYLEEKETGKYIPYSEDEYIMNMTDPVPAVNILKSEMIKLTTLQNTIENCKKTGESFSKTVDTEYLGYDDIIYEARATLEIEPDGDWQVSLYDYYDPEKEEWIDTGERNEISEAEINNIFFV
jgi:hypothetical protein